MLLGVDSLLLIIVSLLTQGPIPVCQAAAKAKGLQQAALVTIIPSVAGAVGFAVLVTLPADGFGLPGSLEARVYWAAAGAGVLYTASNVLIYWAAPIIGPTHFGLVFTLRVVPLALFSALPSVNEPLTWWKTLGIATILAGVGRAKMLEQQAAKQAAAQQEEKAVSFSPKQIRWAWAGAMTGTVFFGSANVCDAIVVKQVDTATYIPVRLLLPVLLIGTGLLVTRKWVSRRIDVRMFVAERRVALLGMAVFVPLSAATFMWALQQTDPQQPALLGSIHQLSLFATILIGSWVTKGKSGSLRAYALPALLCGGGVALILGLFE